MKLGVFLVIVAVIVTLSYFHDYVYGSRDIGGGLAMWFVAFPCYYWGIRCIRKHRAKKSLILGGRG